MLRLTIYFLKVLWFLFLFASPVFLWHHQ